MLRTIQLAKKLSLLMTEDVKVGRIGSNNENIERSPLMSKNLNGAINYLTLDIKKTFSQLVQTFT